MDEIQKKIYPKVCIQDRFQKINHFGNVKGNGALHLRSQMPG